LTKRNEEERELDREKEVAYAHHLLGAVEDLMEIALLMEMIVLILHNGVDGAPSISPIASHIRLG